MTIDYSIIGDSGLKRYGGTIDEEWLGRLKGTKAVKIYQEMSDNDAVIGAIFFCIEMLCRQVKWSVEPGTDDEQGQQVAKFVDECREDMSHTWEDLISEILSMLKYGWAYFETVYKIRQGNQKDPQRRSKYNDNRYGWRKIALRSQESLDRWEIQDDGGISGMHQFILYGSKTGSVFIPIEKALLFRTKIDKQNPEGRSILRNAYRSWYMLKKLQEIEAIGIERDLAGLPKMEVPLEFLSKGADANQKALIEQLQGIMKDIRNDERAYLMLPAEIDSENKPTGFKFSLVSTSGSRAFDTDKIITRYEQRIAMSVLAQFILLGMDKVGSFSLANSQTSLFLTALSAWMNSIASVFNRFAIPRLLEVNGIKVENPPQLKPGSVQDISLTELADFMQKTGLSMSLVNDLEMENYLRNKANLPLKEEETVL